MNLAWDCVKASQVALFVTTIEYFDRKNCSWEKSLIGKLVLEWKNEILEKNETSIMIKKHAQKKIFVLFARFYQQLCYFYCQLLFLFVPITNTQEI